MAQDSAEWHIPHPLSGRGWALFFRAMLVWAVAVLAYRVWDYATGDGRLLQLALAALWVVIVLLGSQRLGRGWVVRADETGLQIPRAFVTRHIPWSDIKDVRPDAEPPWGTGLFVILQDGRELPTLLPPDHEELPRFWARVSDPPTPT